MTTTLEDMKGGESNCCGAQVYIDLGICSDCKEHCEVVKYFCDKCKDTGDIEILGDGEHFEVGVIDIKRCNCQDD